MDLWFLNVAMLTGHLRVLFPRAPGRVHMLHPNLWPGLLPQQRDVRSLLVNVVLIQLSSQVKDAGRVLRVLVLNPCLCRSHPPWQQISCHNVLLLEMIQDMENLASSHLDPEIWSKSRSSFTPLSWLPFETAPPCRLNLLVDLSVMSACRFLTCRTMCVLTAAGRSCPSCPDGCGVESVTSSVSPWCAANTRQRPKSFFFKLNIGEYCFGFFV